MRRVGWVFGLVIMAAQPAIVRAEPAEMLLRIEIAQPVEYRVHTRGEFEMCLAEEVALPPEVGHEIPAVLDVMADVRLSPEPPLDDQRRFRLAVNSLKASFDILGHNLTVEGDRQHFDFLRDGKSQIGTPEALPLGFLAALPSMIFGQDLVTITYDPRGQILDATLAGIAKLLGGEAEAQGKAGLKLGQFPALLPLDPVRLFQGWHGEAPFQVAALGLSGQAEYFGRLKGFKVIAGHPCAWVSGRARISVQQALRPPAAEMFSLPGLPNLAKTLPPLTGSGSFQVTGDLYIEPAQRELMGGGISVAGEAALSGAEGQILGKVRVSLSVEVTRIS